MFQAFRMCPKRIPSIIGKPDESGFLGGMLSSPLLLPLLGSISLFLLLNVSSANEDQGYP
jgi:hypothetical protein